MDFTFSFEWMAIGAAIAIAGGVITYFYRPIAENLASGVSSYDKVKIFGILTIVVGLLIMSNLASLILTWLAQIVFKR